MNIETKDKLWNEIESILKPPERIREGDITISEYADEYGIDPETARRYMKMIAKQSDEFEYIEVLDTSIKRVVKVLRKVTKS